MLWDRQIGFDRLDEVKDVFCGNECNVMAKILLSRYDLFINQNIRIQVTTNRNAEELEKLYGNRVRSRLRSMFNLISFPETTKDKRK